MFKINVKVGYKEIVVLTFFFTWLAVYLNIHEEKLVFNFFLDHIIALFISIIISRIIYEVFNKK